jgi:uncharacterized protein|tara:strand:- start:286 stop:780 length:495 start_codon:yes stop_codon:yes gene_type:complete
MNIPTKEECLEILKNNGTLSNIIEHCKTVANLASKIADNLIKKGIKINKDLVIAGALLHDIERHKPNHIESGTNLIKSLGYPEVAQIIKHHSLYQIEKEEVQPKTIEEKVVFYADKKIKGNKVTNLKERLDDAAKRHNVDLTNEYEYCKKIEKEIFGDKIPDLK